MARYECAVLRTESTSKRAESVLTAGLDYLLMGGARGTRSLTWQQTEDGAKKIGGKGGKSGGSESTQTTNRAGAAFFGASVDGETGQASAG